MTSTISSNRRGWARNSDWICTPLLKDEKKSPNRLKASSGAPVALAASSRRGARRVNSSRPRSVRVAATWPWCQLRMVCDTRAGWEKPIRVRVAKVSGSSSTPVNTRLPNREDSGSSSWKSSPYRALTAFNVRVIAASKLGSRP